MRLVLSCNQKTSKHCAIVGSMDSCHAGAWQGFRGGGVPGAATSNTSQCVLPSPRGTPLLNSTSKAWQFWSWSSFCLHGSWAPQCC
ncbi:hypothetical protein Y1Q_0009510 [Alligator mississippiensis]|uniref:Uncharacterized protein n=1 Tax=Alligator mississippiensis TaxID=8496 RepID=A0A151NVL1_ALLMI|nr:hypothetical protein Y1Q_0009510 [Alligator mississippiensis]